MTHTIIVCNSIIIYSLFLLAVLYFHITFADVSLLKEWLGLKLCSTFTKRMEYTVIKCHLLARFEFWNSTKFVELEVLFSYYTSYVIFHWLRATCALIPMWLNVIWFHAMNLPRIALPGNTVHVIQTLHYLTCKKSKNNENKIGNRLCTPMIFYLTWFLWQIKPLCCTLALTGVSNTGICNSQDLYC